MKENRFESLLFTLIEDFVKQFTDWDNDPCTKGKALKRISKFSYKNFRLSKDFLDHWNEVKTSVLDITDYERQLSSWLSMVEEFLLFIRTAEKCVMYENSDTKTIYSEILNENKRSIYFIYDLYKVKITFENTKIRNPAKTDIALSMFSDSTIKIMNIEIIRTFGKQMKNVFKYITGELFLLEETSDIILLENMMRCISRQIYQELCVILNSVIPIYTGITTIDWEELVQDGLWIRKH